MKKKPILIFHKSIDPKIKARINRWHLRIIEEQIGKLKISKEEKIAVLDSIIHILKQKHISDGLG